MGTTIDVDGQRYDAEALLRAIDKADCEESLYTFLQYAWRYIDPAPFVPGWPVEAMAEHLQYVVDGEIRRLIINIPPRALKSSLVSICFPAWTWAQPAFTPTSGPGIPFLCGSYAEKLALRDSVKCRRLIESPWYQSLWGDRFKLTSDQNTKSRFENDKGGARLITSVDAAVTGEGAQIILLDDPNNATDVMSAATIEATIEWWTGALSTRLNDPKTGAYIVIQQRLGEQDLTGHLLETQANDWLHLMIPMRYEPERSYFLPVSGWKDPRTTPGELMWPERFGEAEVADLERRLGPWRCNPSEAPILMADLSMRPICDTRVGDEIVGFSKGKRRGGRAFGRMRLEKSIITEIHQHIAPVVKMTLESGEVIRCTRDHRWYTKDRGPNREMYMPVTMRNGRSSRLARVCPARLPELTADDQRLAGWVAGFFDGEGTVSSTREGDGYAPASQISFYQGAGRNLPLCEKLEAALRYFGFEFTCREDMRQPNKNAPCYGYRCYRLVNSCLPMLQRFLHVVQPTKWKKRIIDGAFKSSFIQGRERVISIEPDGEEVVYGLTTTTGNYVVWGLASSNSAGQLQQRPEPKGGGIIKRDWWNAWEQSVYPPMDYILASLDTAHTTKEENDPSAMTVWGVYSGQGASTAQILKSEIGGRVTRTFSQEPPRLMMMYAWQDRLEIHQLIHRVVSVCRQMKVDKLIIENKARGHEVAQELRRLFQNENFMVQLIDPKGTDKMARLYSVQHIFSEGMVTAPDKEWAEMVIAQCGTFPRGKHDDLVDTVSQALRHLRDLGLLQRATEVAYDEQQSKLYRGPPPPPLYGVP